jgi:hypothetical protein
MSAVLVKTSARLQARLQSIPPVSLWGAQSVPLEGIREYVQTLEAACLEDSRSMDRPRRAGMVYAVDDCKAMDAPEVAVSSPERQCRLRALVVAEEETLNAVELAQNIWQLSLAQRQLQAIWKLARDSTRSVSWERPLAIPVLVLPALPLAGRPRPS